ncbi:MAG: hypothetical protein ACFFD4_40395 [Candidatus Odinarchaeota archaeon]
MNTFTNKTGFGANLKESLSNGAKQTTDSIGNLVGTVGKAFTSFLPLIIVGGIFIIVGLIVFLKIYNKFLPGTPKSDSSCHLG